MTMSTTLITSRDPKGLQATSIFEAAYNQANLDDPRAQRLNENGGELKAGILKLIADLSVSDKYKGEEVESSYGYLSGYKPKGIPEQVAILKTHFPNLDYSRLAVAQVFVGAEGAFAIPNWRKLAETYNEAVQIVLAKLSDTRKGKFYNYRTSEMGPANLRESDRKAAFMQKYFELQDNPDVAVMAAQFGLTHRGRSVRRVREVMRANESGLGAFEVGVMLLTHSERLQHYDDLWVDCAGDEFKPGDGRGFPCAPLFDFSVGKLEFDAAEVGRAHDYYGTASGFLPQ